MRLIVEEQEARGVNSFSHDFCSPLPFIGWPDDTRQYLIGPVHFWRGAVCSYKDFSPPESPIQSTQIVFAYCPFLPLQEIPNPGTASTWTIFLKPHRKIPKSLLRYLSPNHNRVHGSLASMNVWTHVCVSTPSRRCSDLRFVLHGPGLFTRFESSEVLAAFLASTTIPSDSWRLCSLANATAPRGFVVKQDGATGYVAFSGIQEMPAGVPGSGGPGSADLVPLDATSNGRFPPFKVEGGGAAALRGDGEEEIPAMVHAGMLQLFISFLTTTNLESQVSNPPSNSPIHGIMIFLFLFLYF